MCIQYLLCRLVFQRNFSGPINFGGPMVKLFVFDGKVVVLFEFFCRWYFSLLVALCLSTSPAEGRLRLSPSGFYSFTALL